jgi:hypothetical protein
MPNTPPTQKPLSYENEYPCPVCRWGKISSMPLMEAVSCDFCQHIFTIDLEQQVLKMSDRFPSLSWRWNGHFWQDARLGTTQIRWWYWLAALVLVLFPPSLIVATALIFPPIEGTFLAQFPYWWAGLTFFVHLSIVVWLFVEAYQFPLRLYIQAMAQSWRRQF